MEKAKYPRLSFPSNLVGNAQKNCRCRYGFVSHPHVSIIKEFHHRKYVLQSLIMIGLRRRLSLASENKLKMYCVVERSPLLLCWFEGDQSLRPELISNLNKVWSVRLKTGLIFDPCKCTKQVYGYSKSTSLHTTQLKKCNTNI